MKVHVLALADIPVTRQTPCCAFTWKAYHLCKMLRMRGHRVILYGCWGSDPTIADEFVEVVGENLVQYAHPGVDWSTNQIRTDQREAAYTEYHRRTRFEVMKRADYGVFEPVCATIGWIEPACRNLQDNQVVIESGMGYKYSFAKFRVFESYSLMHYIWGLQQKGETIKQFPLDAVIPNYFDPKMFTADLPRENYALFMGRVNDDKGWPLALEACNKFGIHLKVVGQLWPGQEKEVIREIESHGGEWEPAADIERRKELMGKAYAFFCPTQYCEDFGGVAVEAQMSGCPVITSDWGGFTDTVLHGKTGFRCHTVQDMVDALKLIPTIDRQLCRRWAVDNFSLERVSYMYDEYLHRVAQHVTGKKHPDRPTNVLWSAKSFPEELGRSSVDARPQKDKIGFFFQVYRQPKATEFVLDSVRKVYPNSPMVLISDGGDDYSVMAERFNCLYAKDEQLGNGSILQFDTAGKARKWLLRLADAMSSLRAHGCEWTMLLEDDTWVRSLVSLPPTDAGGIAASFDSPHSPYVPALRTMITSRRGKPINGWYGGCGGTLLKNATCEPAIRSFANSPVFESDFFDAPALQWSDMLITAALGIANITFSKSKCHGIPETDLENSGVAVIHGYKKHYVS